ncbi:hypothetical protein ANCDUO_23011 [Ancylostoma duodenale]|uniref:G-protein coupled receptors family 1 profile domain-containing protein n=1 Tax=Ancylostoma duodenale TaxID=51022 RepID=A0A0C2BST6_9BILA|nr:hypothetical protein ANCDUO_23011 [Ancylostoma duodenale]
MNTFYMYVFPVQFFLGVIGNALNLCVLLSRHMRSEVSASVWYRAWNPWIHVIQANYLLSALAIADILLFLTMLPSALGVWPSFYTNDYFRRFFYHSHTMRHWFSNVFSCMTSWLILAVSVESDTDSRQKRDRKVTITVLAIIACFFLTHTPSTVPFILELISPIMTPPQREYIRRLMPELGPIVHGWLLTGKVMNFVLFCMSSVYFRRRLRAIIRSRIFNGKIFDKSKISGIETISLTLYRDCFSFLCAIEPCLGNSSILEQKCAFDTRLKKTSGMSSGYSARWQAVRMNTLIYRESAVRQSSYVTQLE